QVLPLGGDLAAVAEHGADRREEHPHRVGAHGDPGRDAQGHEDGQSEQGPRADGRVDRAGDDTHHEQDDEAERFHGREPYCSPRRGGGTSIQPSCRSLFPDDGVRNRNDEFNPPPPTPPHLRRASFASSCGSGLSSSFLPVRSIATAWWSVLPTSMPMNTSTVSWSGNMSSSRASRTGLAGVSCGFRARHPRYVRPADASLRGLVWSLSAIL